MIFSEDNYGRFEAIACILSWMAVGAGSMFLLIDLFQVLQQGFPDVRSAAVSAVALAILIWQGRAAVSAAQEIKQMVRYDHSPLPTPLIASVLTASLLAGAATIFAYRFYLIQYFEQLDLPYDMIAIHGLSAIACMSFWTLVAGLTAWFVVYPRVLPEEKS